MTRFEFLSVLISIVIALGMSDIVSTWGTLLRSRRAVSFYWLHTAWTLIVLLLFIQFWWGFWNFRTVSDWSFGMLIAVVGEAILMVLAGALITPPRESDKTLDLRKFFFDNNRIFFMLGALLIVMLGLVDYVVAGQPLIHAENAVRLGAVSICAVGAIARSERVHAALVFTGVFLFAIFVLVEVTN